MARHPVVTLSWGSSGTLASGDWPPDADEMCVVQVER